MEIILDLANQKSYKWFSNGRIYFKGYFQYDNDKLHHAYREIAAIDELVKIEDYKGFIDFLTQIDGCFSVIIEKDNSVWAAVDISRSLPIYYSKNGRVISDSAESIRDYLKISRDQVDNFAYIQLLSSDYLFGRKTVYNEIGQLDLGECVCINKDEKKINFNKYFKHIETVDTEIIKEDAKKKLHDIAYDSFYALKNVIGNRPVLLSLSGGYDSRYVACLLKETGFEDVSCYTYGKADSFEVAESRKVADALGFRWTYVEMTDSWLSQQLDSVGVSYLNSYNGHDFTAYMQNFPAVRKLHEEGWIKPNSVVLTGLCGDMPTGTYIEPFDKGKDYSLDTAAERLYSLIVSRYKLPDRYKDQWLTEVKVLLNDANDNINDYQSWVSAIDCIYTGTCHSHWFMHMNTVHAFFGYEWLLPFWNKKLLKFWYSIPADMRIGRKLYAEWLLESVCSKYGLGQKKYVAKYSEHQYIEEIMYKVGGVICYLLLNIGIPFKRKYDYNNFAPYELQLFKKLLTRETVSYERASLFHLLNQYCLQHRYGVEIMKRALKLIKH